MTVDISSEAVERLATTFDKKAARHSGGTVAQGFDINCANVLRAQAERIKELEDDLAGMRAEGKRMRREVEISRNDALREALSAIEEFAEAGMDADAAYEAVEGLIEGDTND